jgi:hypothetical protein
MDFGVLRCEIVGLIELVLYIIQFRTFVNSVMNFWVPQKGISWQAERLRKFSRKTLQRGASLLSFLSVNATFSD